MTGIVHLVGAGPGDPGLITVAGREALERADVVVHDRLGTEALLGLCPPGAELLDAGKAPGRAAMTQDEINAALVEHGRRGRRVVRLKGGDPFVFGRGGEEAEALAAAGVAVRVVPGITSAIAAPAAAGIPVTHRGVATSFTVVTGHEDPVQALRADRLGGAGGGAGDAGRADGHGAAGRHRGGADGRRAAGRRARGRGPVGHHPAPAQRRRHPRRRSPGAGRGGGARAAGGRGGRRRRRRSPRRSRAAARGPCRAGGWS